MVATKNAPTDLVGVNKTIASATANGAAPEANPSRAMPRIFEWVELPEDAAGKGAKVLVWSNFPQSWGKKLDEATEDAERFALLHQFVRDHDLYDFEGVKLPPADTDDFILAIPVTLWPVIFASATANLTTLPKAMPPR